MCTCLPGSTKYSFIYGLISRHISTLMVLSLLIMSTLVAFKWFPESCILNVCI